MKKLFFALIFLLTVTTSYSQLVISPYIVFLDAKNKYGTYTVYNETDETKEVTISFKFAYPVSDADGNITMFYDTTNNSRSIADWVKAFPRKFTMSPRGKQIIRMTVDPPAGMNQGTYWTRIVTTSSSLKSVTDSTTGISAKINFFFNQVTTAIYRNQRYDNKLEFRNLTTNTDTANVNIIAGFGASGDQPFFSKIEYKIYDSNNKAVIENMEYVAVYYDILKKFSFRLDGFKPGKYTAEMTISSENSSDVPKTDKGLIQPITKKVDFVIQ